jgi:hypothetical protein
MNHKTNSKLLFYIEDYIRTTGKGHNIEQVMLDNDLTLGVRPDETKLNIVFSDQAHIGKFKKIKNKILVDDNQIDFNSYAEVLAFVKTVLAADWLSSFSLKLLDSEKNLDRIKNKNLSSNKEAVENVANEIGLITDFEIMLLREYDIEKWNEQIKNFNKKNYIFSNILFLKEKDIVNEKELLDPCSFVLQLLHGAYFLIIKEKNLYVPENELKLELLIMAIMKSVQSIDQLGDRDIGEVDFWKKIFSKIPYPMAVISQLGEPLIYNEHFASVGILPRECLSYRDNDHLEIKKQHYKIRRFDFSFHNNTVYYYIFYTSEKTMNNPNNELGIVSSSIAHELNNPLAGILAALSLLRLENNWSEEAILEIEEMKEGAKRCKELVEIFLGFSRIAPKNHGESSLKLSLAQAINLLRFRMVESDLRIDMKLNSEDEKIHFDINSSVLSMILYLILNELLTAFAHHRLLTTKTTTLLEGKVLGSTHHFQFLLNEEFEFESNIINSKLLQHLLFFEKLEMVFLKKEIRILKNYK